MVVPDRMVKGGIASVVNGYRGSELELRNKIIYVESYCDGSKWCKFKKACGAYIDFVKNINSEKPDVIHIHSSFGPSFYRKMPFVLWAEKKKIPIVNHIHGAEFDAFYEKAASWKQRLVRRVYNKCTRLIVLSEEWKERMKHIVPEEKIVIIENYCKIPEEIVSGRRKPEQILFLGELGERKGCYDIPLILQKVVRQHPEVKLIMAGDGDMIRLQKAFADKDLSENVVFPGWVRGEEKVKLLKESQVFLFPSYHEGMPMAVLEAMGYGLGIVTTRVGGIPRLIQDGENGFCKTPGDIEAMSAAITDLLQNREKCEKLGMLARKLVSEKFGPEQHLQKVQQVYEAVTDRVAMSGQK